MPETDHAWLHDMWHTRLMHSANRRIFEQPTHERQTLQAQTELLVVLHSIRRILMWVTIIVPIIAVVFWLLVSASTVGVY